MTERMEQIKEVMLDTFMEQCDGFFCKLWVWIGFYRDALELFIPITIVLVLMVLYYRVQARH